MTTPSDDECIALAMLHGAEFYLTDWKDRDGTRRWFYATSGTPGHPFNSYMSETTGRFSTATRGEIARA